MKDLEDMHRIHSCRPRQAGTSSGGEIGLRRGGSHGFGRQVEGTAMVLVRTEVEGGGGRGRRRGKEDDDLEILAADDVTNGTRRVYDSAGR